ncbi:MAG: hypothetical protein CSYNP_01279 [Syntrophus sp. SKADARSKE-3]|nr:hypothetical protein [Syntrophus sp. SKADARSKE-3]
MEANAILMGQTKATKAPDMGIIEAALFQIDGLTAMIEKVVGNVDD